MTTTAWLVRGSTGDLLSADWSADAAEEYAEERNEAVTVERLDFEVAR